MAFLLRSPDGAQRNPGLLAIRIDRPRISLRSIRATLYPAPNKLLLPERGGESIAPSGEHHMTNILTFFSTRTLVQIIFVLGSAVAMKAWSLGLLFGG